MKLGHHHLFGLSRRKAKASSLLPYVNDLLTDLRWGECAEVKGNGKLIVLYMDIDTCILGISLALFRAEEKEEGMGEDSFNKLPTRGGVLVTAD